MLTSNRELSYLLYEYSRTSDASKMKFTIFYKDKNKQAMKKIYIWSILTLIIETLLPGSLLAQARTSANNVGAVEQRETRVTPMQALDVGYAFMRTGTGTRGGGGTRSSDVRKQAMQLVYTGQATDSLTGAITDCYFVFSLQPKGFVIVAADERVEPILGYSYDNNFVVADMPDHVRGWLGSYAQQIQTVSKSEPHPAPSIQTKWTRLKSGQSINTRNGITVGPLLTTTWDQAPYYNTLCPMDANGPGGHALAGCVATAMAQIINYWGYPVHGRGTHSYSSNYGTLTVDYDSANYDYTNMPTALTATSTADEVNAVATLMRDCGVAVNMIYSASESGTYIPEIRSALVNHFRYSPLLACASRSYYTDDEWFSLLKNSIDNSQPIIYSGESVVSFLGGHTFILDGYDSDDFFHFNFGWSGYMDGWYKLTPVSSNLGSVYGNGCGYIYNQTAYLGIVPDSISNVFYSQNGAIIKISSPIDMYNVNCNNSYRGAYHYEPYYDTVIIRFVSEDTNKRIVLDIMDFLEESIGQEHLSIHDGLTNDSLLRDIISIGSSSQNLSPVISSSYLMTLVYTTHLYRDGLHIRVSQEDSCRMVSNVSAIADGDLIYLRWQENGDATQWRVEYGPQGFVPGEGMSLFVDTNFVIIHDTLEYSIHEFHIQPICDTSDNLYIFPINVSRRVYWTDVVLSKPEGYLLDSLGTIHISTPEGLAWFAKTAYTKENNNWNSFISYVSHDISIDNDLDMSEYYWNPIPYFRGNLYGNGHVISNMTVEGLWGTIGLFRETHCDTIKDLGFINAMVYDHGSCTDLGSIVGLCQGNTSIINCYSVNHLISTEKGSWSGGLIGMATLGVSFYNCYSIGQVYATTSTGGIVGSISVGSMKNCYASVKGNYGFGRKSSWTGRLCGASGGSFDNCFADIDSVQPDIRHPSNFIIGQRYSNNTKNLSGFSREGNTLAYTVPDSISENYLYNGSIDLVTALNSWVKETNSPVFRTWVWDSLSGLPVFGDYFEVTCPNVSNITARNIQIQEGFGVALTWAEDGSVDEWQIKCRPFGSINDENAVYYSSHTASDTLIGLTLGNVYEIFVRSVCQNDTSPKWGNALPHLVDKIYWTDIVTSCPEGYVDNGDGSISISSAEGLAWMSVCSNGLHGQAKNSYDGVVVKIVEDIDLGQYKWMPIGWYHDDQAGFGLDGVFSGTLIGFDHVISNLYCNENENIHNGYNLFGDEISQAYNIGLFGMARFATIQDINIENAYIKGSYNLGSLVGLVEFGTINNCHVYNDTTIGGDYAGGLIGAAYYYEYYDPAGQHINRFYNLSASGTIIGDVHIGGLIGMGGDDSEFANCYANANIYNTNNIFPLMGSKGGIAAGVGKIANSYSAGNIEYTLHNLPIGYFVGIVSSSARYIYAIPSDGYSFLNYSESATISDWSDIMNGQLNTPVTIDNITYTSLLDALNAWVDTYDTTGLLLHWVADTAGVNGGFPIFEEIRHYTLTLAVADSTPYGTVSGAGIFRHIDPAIIKAMPNYGYHFVQWNDGNTDNPRTISLSHDTTFTAIFEKNLYGIKGTLGSEMNYSFDFEDPEQDYKWTLLNGDNIRREWNHWIITTLNDTNRALIISDENEISNTYNIADQTSKLAYTTVTLDSGEYYYSYEGFRGNTHNTYLGIALIPSSTQLPTVVTAGQMPSNAIYLESLNGENWTQQSGQVIIPTIGEYSLWILWRNYWGGGGYYPAPAIDNIYLHKNTPDGENACGYVLGSDTVPYLDTVTLTAVPYEGYRFLGWHDGNTDNPRSVVATADMSYVATFECIPYNVSDSLVACGSYTWHDSIYTTSTLLVESFTSQAGCDSVVTHYLTIYPLASENVNVSICESDLPYTFHFGDRDTIFEVGTPPFSTLNFKLSTIHGCDSIITLNLTVNHGTHNVETETACESFTWHGQTYTTSGTYTHAYTNADGCASMDTMHLTVNYGTHNVETETVCEGFTWHGHTYTSSGTYTYAYTNADGCASVDTLHLTVNHGTHNVETETACESFTWHGHTYTSSGTYTHAYTNADGCASVDTLKLTINYGTHNVVTETACESFTWHGHTYTSSGTYTHAYTNADGCASVDTLKLTVNYGTHNVETETACESFTWHGQTYTSSGTYTHAYTNSDGCASVDALKLTVNYGTHNVETETACESFTWHGHTYTTSGTYTHAYTNNGGCASVDTLKLTVNYGTHNVVTETACESFTWHGHTYTSSDTYTHAYTNANGCASVDTLILIVNPTKDAEFTISCPDSCYVWNDQTYCTSGDYTQTLQTVHGCDSVVTLHLTITVGINDHNTFDFKVYPNPTNGMVNVQFTNHNSPITHIQVFDIYGKLLDVVETLRATSLQTGTGASAQTQIDLSRYANGVYFIKAVADGNVIGVRKVVKQ